MRNLGLLSLLLTVFSALPARALPPPPTCPETPTTAEGDAPQYVQMVPGQGQLFICGKKKNSFNRDVYSEFTLLYQPHEKDAVKLPLEAGVGADYGLVKTPSGFTLQEMALIDNEWLPLFRRDIRCTKTACKVTRRSCANIKPTRKARNAHAVIEAYRGKASHASTGQATDPTEIDLVLAAAISGNPEAIEAFNKNPGFRLDGASTEAYEYGKKLLKELKAKKCKLH